jgi:hypothetical protein
MNSTIHVLFNRSVFEWQPVELPATPASLVLLHCLLHVFSQLLYVFEGLEISDFAGANFVRHGIPSQSSLKLFLGL